MKRADADREVITISRKDLTNELFAYLLDRDDPYPLVVVPDPGEILFQYPWDAEFFASIFPDTECDIENCATSIISRRKVAEFFRRFGRDDDAKLVEKIRVILSYYYLRAWTY